ncbi:FUSC family protein [Ichthyenterobacterium magnum]|uniref:FUSC family protein n=1 Tax=Ichthyenterobacterium magnum TaxID=1230530 RepID=A0A420DL56_9FLAO|nr:FUSC family protein [Ichthyenterobacterium magnum]RKE94907.1 hypothetical protein BXY80_1921 [Ichthyenterobacterium magnum]
MRKLLIILGFITATLAVILAVTPLSKMAFIPAILAFIFGLIALKFSKAKQLSKKSIQLIFLLTIISISLATYKTIFQTSEVGDTQELELRDEESVEDSKEILEDLDLDELDDIE